MALRIISAIAIFAAMTALFLRASETLSPKRLNLISITYYVYAVMVYLGAALAYCGLLREHYLIAKLSTETIDFTYAAVASAGLGLGALFLLVGWLFKRKGTANPFGAFINSGTSFHVDERSLFLYVVTCSCAGLLATVYTFVTLGGMPVLDVLLHGSDEAASMRWLASHAFGGNEYVRNIGMLVLVPLCNLMSFAGWRISKKANWAALFGVTLVLNIVALTWDLEKAPIAIHVFYLFVLACLVDFRPTTLQVVGVFAAAGVLVLLGYILTSGGVGTMSLTSGPISRMVTTPVGALGLHFKYFPDVHDYLNGASIQPYWAALLGLDESGVRSGAIVMGLSNPAGVANNTAGVMNAFFIGEAYANWGIFGIAVSIVVVGLVMGLLHNYLIRLPKTFFSIMAYCVLIKFNFTTLMGGFVDYFSVANLIPFAIVLLPLLIFRFDLATRQRLSSLNKS